MIKFPIKKSSHIFFQILSCRRWHWPKRGRHDRNVVFYYVITPTFCDPLPFSFNEKKYWRLKSYQMSNFTISIKWSISLVYLVRKMVSSKTCHMEVLPILIIEGAALIWILVAPSKNWDRQKIQYDICCKNVLLLVPPLKSTICEIFFAKFFI